MVSTERRIELRCGHSKKACVVNWRERGVDRPGMGFLVCVKGEFASEYIRFPERGRDYVVTFQRGNSSPTNASHSFLDQLTGSPGQS